MVGDSQSPASIHARIHAFVVALVTQTSVQNEQYEPNEQYAYDEQYAPREPPARPRGAGPRPFLHVSLLSLLQAARPQLHGPAATRLQNPRAQQASAATK